MEWTHLAQLQLICSHAVHERTQIYMGYVVICPLRHYMTAGRN